jgi:hypothetical protein
MAFGLSAGAAALIGSVAAPVVSSLLAPGDHGAGAANQASINAENTQAQISQDQWKRYLQLYAPAEQEYLDSAKGLGSIANQNKAAQQAEADVASQFGGARQKLNEMPGANPSSEAYLRANSDLNMAEAASSAAAQSGARELQKDKGRAALTDALSLGKGLPAQAMTGLSSAASGLNAAAQFAQKQANYEGQAIGKTIGGITGSTQFQNWIGGLGGGPQQSYNPGAYSMPTAGGDTYYGLGQNWGV